MKTFLLKDKTSGASGRFIAWPDPKLNQNQLPPIVQPNTEQGP